MAGTSGDLSSRNFNEYVVLHAHSLAVSVREEELSTLPDTVSDGAC